MKVRVENVQNELDRYRGVAIDILLLLSEVEKSLLLSEVEKSLN